MVAGASSIKVTLYNGDTYDAALIGSDSDYDVAVLKINAEGLQPVTLGDSADVNVGDYVLAIGNPLGELTFSMSQGIVSSCNRAINVDGTPFNMIQVDCSINPGNSGGPLMNLYGEVVGIVSAKYSTYSTTTVEGLGFAIPISDVKSIITDIMENGAVTDKAYMAITAGTMTAQMAAQYSIDVTQGVFVYSVVEGGAGDKAGLRLGDVITKLNDTTLTSRQDMSAAMKNYRAGDTVTLTVYRDGQYITTELTSDAQPQTTGSDTDDTTTDNGGGYSGQIPRKLAGVLQLLLRQPPRLMLFQVFFKFFPHDLHSVWQGLIKFFKLLSPTFSCHSSFFPAKLLHRVSPFPLVPAGIPGGDTLPWEIVMICPTPRLTLSPVDGTIRP